MTNLKLGRIGIPGGIMEKYEFHGFTPAEGLRQEAECSLLRILDRTPSDSRVRASLSADGKQYMCRIEVGSASFPVLVETIHASASQAVRDAEKTVERKLQDWHRVRFAQVQNQPLGERGSSVSI